MTTPFFFLKIYIICKKLVIQTTRLNHLWVIFFNQTETSIDWLWAVTWNKWRARGVLIGTRLSKSISLWTGLWWGEGKALPSPLSLPFPCYFFPQTESLRRLTGICSILKKAILFSIVLISLPFTRILKNGPQSGDLRVEGRKQSFRIS